jgi:TonB-dependent starch-binding outer membrane protein SusC
MKKTYTIPIRSGLFKCLIFFILIISSSISFAQIVGKVIGEDGDALPGVSVVVKNTNKGVTTDVNGRFSVDANANSTLVFTYIGYNKVEEIVGNRTSINVSMTIDALGLTEIVVVGYGTQKKASLTGAVASVGSKEIAAYPVTSIESAIQGRMAGVQVTNNGSPGEGPIVRVRGVGSINYASGPIYVVDGFPVGNLNDFDYRDVESMDVLKDASAAAIYGSRAANGVILVTTKKGNRDGKIKVNFETSYQSSKAAKRLDLLNREQYLAYGKTMLTAAGAAFPDRWKELDQPTYKGSSQTFNQTDVDMQDYMFKTAGTTHHSVNISGGNATSRFYTALANFNQDGIFVGTNYSRNNFRLNSDHALGKFFTFGQTLTVASANKLDEAAGGGRTTLQNVIKSVPYIPVFNPTEIGGFYGTTNADGSDPANPVLAATLLRGNGKNLRLLGTVFLEANIASFLKYRFTTGLDYNNSRFISRTPIFTSGQNGSAKNGVSDSRGDFWGTLYTNQLTFDKSFGKHNINLIGVAEQQYGTGEGITATGTYTTNNFNVITSNTADQAIGGGKGETVLLSYLSRLNYEYAGKYLLSASIRRDGYSIFAPGKKWGTFPALSVGWRVSEESFMKDVPAVSELKVRLSYGLVGNVSGFPNYAWQSVVGASTNTVFSTGLSPGLSVNQLGNANLGWELTKMTNIGIDLGLMRGKFTFSADYYIRQTADSSLILEQPLATSLGFSNSTIANLGSIKNTGLDFQFGYNHTANNGFKWSLLGNVSTNNVLVNVLVAPINRGNHGGETAATVTKTELGQSIQYFYGFVVDKIYQSKEEIDADDKAAVATKKALNYQGGKAAPGDIRFKDINGDGFVDDSDRTKIGNPFPDFIYGLNFDASYKNFDANIFFQGTQGNDIYNNLVYVNTGATRLFGATTEVLNAWTPTNTNTKIPRSISGDPNGNATKASDRFVEDGSYLRIKNISFGYSLPKSLINTWSRGAISKLRIYVAAQNQLTLTKYTGYTPEIGSRGGSQLLYGVDDGTYPQPKSVLAGLQIGF